MLKWIGGGFQGRRYGPQLHSRVSLNGIIYKLGDFVHVPDELCCDYVICEIIRLYEQNDCKMMEGRIYLFASQTIMASPDKWELFQTEQTMVQFIRKIHSRCSVLLLNTDGNPASANQYYSKYKYNPETATLSLLNSAKFPRFMYDGTSDHKDAKEDVKDDSKDEAEADIKAQKAAKVKSIDSDYEQEEDEEEDEEEFDDDFDDPEEKVEKVTMKIKIQIKKNEERAKPEELLRLNPVIGRHIEKETIRHYIEDRLERESKTGNGALLIGGLIGSGKTSTVLFVINQLWDEQKHKFNFLDINACRLLSLQETYTLLWKKINGKVHKPKTAMKHMTTYFEEKKKQFSTGGSTTPLVILLDEMDQYFAKNQAIIIYNLLEFSHSLNSGLILIMISTSVGRLQNEFMESRILSRLGRDTLLFNAYRSQEIFEILQSKYGNSSDHEIPESTMKIIALSVSHSTADVRLAYRKFERIRNVYIQNKRNKQQLGGNYDLDYQTHIPSIYSLCIPKLTKFEKIALWIICWHATLGNYRYFILNKVIDAIIWKCKAIGHIAPSPQSLCVLLYRLAQTRIIVIWKDKLGTEFVFLNRNCRHDVIHSILKDCDLWNRLSLSGTV
jgi:Cdc6-like AAA superfamily ATPase